MTLKMKGFDELQKILDPASFESRLVNKVKRATAKVGLDAEREIKEDIYTGKFQRNAPVTTAIKGSARPLVNTGQLAKSINSKQSDWDRVDVGVLRKGRVRDPDSGRFKKGDNDILNVAAVLHFGATIKVTEKMRNFFAMMSRQKPGEFTPLRQSTKVIVIPPRPFLESAIKKSQLDRYENIWGKAIDEAIAGG